MSTSPQDRHYLQVEADAYHDRNHATADPLTLRDYKRRILGRLEKAHVRPRKMLEFGCAYGDLLNHFATEYGTEAHGVEPSAKAAALGNEAFDGKVRIVQGTMAANEIAADASQHGTFDLIVIDDVLCWVSRETLFQSIANVDALLADGGHLYIKEFFPLHQTRNANHHVTEGGVYCYKPRGPHMAMFTASGVYEIVHQEIELDGDDAWVQGESRPPFESRWSNVVLRKSLGEYYD